MLVFGDRSRSVDPRAELETLLAEIARTQMLPAGLGRHAELVAALIACGELAQGLADAVLATRGEDAPDPAADLALQATRALADALIASWRAGFAARRVDTAALGALQRLSLPEQITLKESEGFAFYALYPETYAEAAAVLAPAPTTVVGLRSIGTTLGAMVASALGAERLISVRPVGEPFARTLQVDPALTPPTGRVAVVDEGPGLSGSSFGAVLDWAEAARPDCTTLAFPSHIGDLGLHASPAHRARWADLSKPHVSFEDSIAPRLADWVADLTGPALAPLQDLSGGAWRAQRYRGEAEWPAVNAGQERRKILLHAERGAFLLKFAGLGRIGARKLERARRLAAAGFTLRPLGLRHGFLVEPWMAPADARPVRAAIVDRLAPYLRFRAETLPAQPDGGAGIDALFEMLRVNVAEGFGPDAAAGLEPWRARLSGLSGRVRRVQTDNRLHLHEWIAVPDGGVLKTDALDHAEAHDLVGAQDIAWDVAGATVEFDLSPEEAEALWRAVGGTARAGGAFLGFHRLAYLAFQIGAFSMAAEAHAGWPEEAARLAAARGAYAEKLRRTLAGHA